MKINIIKDNEAYIYKMYDINHPDMFYIGSTKHNPIKRLAYHIITDSLKYPNTKKYKYFKSVGWHNVDMVILHTMNYDDYNDVRIEEQLYIDTYKPPLNTIKACNIRRVITERARQCVSWKYDAKKKFLRKLENDFNLPELSLRESVYNQIISIS